MRKKFSIHEIVLALVILLAAYFAVTMNLPQQDSAAQDQKQVADPGQ